MLSGTLCIFALLSLDSSASGSFFVLHCLQNLIGIGLADALLLLAILFLIFILPVVIILLTVKVLKTFLQIKLRNAASKTVTKDQEKNKGSAPAKRPVSQTSFKPQFITPVPVREKK